MFGYITIHKQELKVKDYDYYHSCYCGLCHTLRKEHGVFAPMTLTYDMTFLSILLTALYEQTYHGSYRVCMLHPLKKQTMRENEITKYAADMTLLLAYHNLMDDWYDDKNVAKLSMAVAIRSEYKKIEKKYPRQTNAVLDYMKKLGECEKKNSKNLDLASGYTGELFREIYLYKKDEWQEPLGNLGFYIGKFIYLMDAYEDVYEDRKNGNYNPFISICGNKGFEERALEILNLMGAGAAKEFERLPILKNADILRNVLYSGIWMKYSSIHEERTKGNR